MPLEIIPDTPLTYYLMSFNKDGRERDDDPDGGILSQRLLADLVAQPPTDIFFMSHGWKGDLPAARDQYNRWVRAMLTCPADVARLKGNHPTFRPLLIGLHWPSLPFGDEEFGAGAASFGLEAIPTIEELVDIYADRVANTPAARAALKVIFEAALTDNEPAALPSSVIDAYRILNDQAGLGADGVAASPGSDREPFDPELAYQNARASAAEDPISFGTFSLSGILSPLAQLSFWQMKDRARKFGEAGAHVLLSEIQVAAPTARLHLMGHSFGCIVVSAAIARPAGSGQVNTPIDTLFLVQGALSLWSYCSKIEAANNVPGYFHSILAEHKVRGVIVATISEFDSAVGRFYPLGAGIAKQVAFGDQELPKYGGVGTFGIQGPDTNGTLVDMLPLDQKYRFGSGQIYNVNGSEYIRNGAGVSGAHSDIAHPEVAHLYWQAIAAGIPN